MTTSINVDLSKLGLNLSANTSYSIQFESGAVAVAAPNNTPAKSGPIQVESGGNVINYTFSTPATFPSVQFANCLPANGAINVMDFGNSYIQFDRNMLVNDANGNITLTNITNSTTVYNFNAGNEISISGGNVRLPIGYRLSPSTAYQWTIPANVLMDTNTLLFGGISAGQLTFTTDEDYWQNLVTLPTSYLVNEDIQSPLFGIEIKDTTPNVNFTVTIESLGNANIVYGNVSNVSHTITGNAATINALFDANAFSFLSAPDFNGLTAIRYVQTQSTNGYAQANVSIPVIVNNSAESILPSIYNFQEDIIGNISGIEITDNAANATYTVTLTTSDYGNIIYNNVANTSHVVTGNRSAINSLLSSNAFTWQSRVDWSGSTYINYKQVNQSNVTQTNQNITVDVAPTADYVVPASYTFNEDVRGNLTGISIVDEAQNKNYNISLNVSNGGNLYYLANVANTLTFSGNKSSLNSILSSNNVYFLGNPDFSGNITIYYNQTQTTDNIIQAANVAIPTTLTPHAEYTAPANLTVNEDITTAISGYAITDLRANVNYSVTVAASSPGNILSANVSNASFTFTGSKSSINANLANLSYVPYVDDNGTRYIYYSQTQTTDGIVQANAVPTTVTIIPDQDYTLPQQLTYEEDNNLTFSGFAITDAAVGKNYNVNVVLSDTALGNLWYANVNYSGNVSLTGNKTAVTSALNTIQFRPVANGFANGTIYYTQLQTTNNILQANAIPTPLNSTGNIPEPVINAWSLDSNLNNNISIRRGFTATQVISGSPGFPIDAANVTYSIPTVTNVQTQPVITSSTKVQSGNDAILTLNGYWTSRMSASEYTGGGNTIVQHDTPYDWRSSFNVITTASNNKKQNISTTLPLFTYIDSFSDAVNPATGAHYDLTLINQVRTTTNPLYYVLVYRLRHFVSGTTNGMITKVGVPNPFNVPSGVGLSSVLISTQNSLARQPYIGGSVATAENSQIVDLVSGNLYGYGTFPAYPIYDIGFPRPDIPRTTTPAIHYTYISICVNYTSTLGNHPSGGIVVYKDIGGGQYSTINVPIYRPSY